MGLCFVKCMNVMSHALFHAVSREPRRSRHCSKTPTLIVFSQCLRRPGITSLKRMRLATIQILKKMEHKYT